MLVFFLVFSFAFQFFAFAFVTGTMAYESTIDTSFLYVKGTFGVSDGPKTVLRNGEWVYFDLDTGGEYKVHWIDAGVNAGNFTICAYMQGPLWLWYWKNSWWYNSTGQTYDSIYYPENGTVLGYSVVGDWDAGNNFTHTWTRHGYWSFLNYVGPATATTIYDTDVFIQDNDLERNNITIAIIEGNVQVTLVKGYNMSAPDLWTFASWFTSAVTYPFTGATLFNLPSVFMWILFLMNLMTILVIVLLAREFIPFLP